MNYLDSLRRIKRIIFGDPAFKPNHCYSQDGEDLVLRRLVGERADGFYVDVGAHHPVRFSNTYLFYKRGWRGINIDAMPGSMAAFRKIRPRDINIECGVSKIAGTVPYFRFNEPALNTFDAREAAFKNSAPYRLIDTIDLRVERLETLLGAHLPARQTIDFLSVDVEGRDEDVLRSNDWARYRPQFVLAESLRSSLNDLGACPIVRFLQSVGYAPVSKAYNTLFFEREKG
jgi:FkbM family methyltransferase